MLRQNKILGNMLGADIDFVVRGIDSKTRSVVASRREAMMRKRQTFYFDLDPDGMYRVYEGRIVQARVIAVAEKVVRVEVFGVECSILARDLAWDWIATLMSGLLWAMKCWSVSSVCGATVWRTWVSGPTSRALRKTLTGTTCRSAASRASTPERSPMFIKAWSMSGSPTASMR